ncbi:hypothetical protein Tco_0443105 [Tanacetum coccineum]
MVAFLEKSTGSVGFHQIIDFLNQSHICYALTKKPEVYVSFIKQFWRSAKASNEENSEVNINAIIDGHSLSITEGSLRRHLKLADQDGITSIPTTKIFEQLALMGYHTDSDKLTFQKGAFSPQWRFLIHNILHCLSPKKTAWEQFSSNIATATICLATNRKFNFSKMSFEYMVSNISSLHKFLMYPRIGVLEADLMKIKKTYNTEVVEDDSSKQGRKFSDEGVQDDEGGHEKASTDTEIFVQEVGEVNTARRILVPLDQRSAGFHQIIDFLNRSHICYALTKKPEVCVSFIKQFWRSAEASTDDNGEVKINATIDGHSLSITEGSLRRHLKLADQDGITSIPNSEIFEQLALMDITCQIS